MEFVINNLKEIIVILAVIIVLFVSFRVLKSKKNRRKIGFHINYLMYKMGLKNRMSDSNIGMVHVRECYEPLVELKPHRKIIINDETVEQPVLLRAGVAKRLYDIAENLSTDTYIKVYSAYRSRVRLYELWKEEVEKIEKENHGLNRGEVLKIAHYKVKSPNVNMGGHDTGAAIDLSLCDKNGNDWDFGSRYHEKSESLSLSKEQQKNRKYLSKLMKSYDFVQQPSQWWHYSYKDRNWSVYKGKRRGAIYGSAEKEFENTGYVRVVKTIISTINK